MVDRIWEDSLGEAESRRLKALEWKRVLPPRHDLRNIEVENRADPGWLRCPILATGSFRAFLSTNVAKKHGIAAGYPKMLSELPVFPGRIVNLREEFAGARQLAAQVFTLPTHRFVSEADFRIIKEFKE